MKIPTSNPSARPRRVAAVLTPLSLWVCCVLAAGAKASYPKLKQEMTDLIDASTPPRCPRMQFDNLGYRNPTLVAARAMGSVLPTSLFIRGL